MNRDNGFMDILHSVPVRNAIGGIHLMMRYLTHATAQYRAVGESDLSLFAGESSREDKQLADVLVARIEEQEKTAIEKLTDQKANHYVVMFANLLLERIGEERPHNEARGKALLDQLRSA